MLMTNTPEKSNVVFPMPLRDTGENPPACVMALNGRKSNGADHQARREEFYGTSSLIRSLREPPMAHHIPARARKLRRGSTAQHLKMCHLSSKTDSYGGRIAKM